VKIKTRKLSKIMTEVRWFTHALVAALLFIPVAGLVPGDSVNLNVIGSLGLIAILVAADLAITVPLSLWLRRLNRPAFVPVRSYAKR
jgi:hypothetical protein